MLKKPSSCKPKSIDTNRSAVTIIQHFPIYSSSHPLIYLLLPLVALLLLHHPLPAGERLLPIEKVELPDIGRGVVLTTILRDRSGFIWLGSETGLHRYDGVRVKSFLHDAGDTTTIASNIIRALWQDKDERLWIGTNEGGTSCLDLRTGAIQHYFHDRSDTTTIRSNDVRHFFQGTSGDIFFFTDKGIDRGRRHSGAVESNPVLKFEHLPVPKPVTFQAYLAEQTSLKEEVFFIEEGKLYCFNSRQERFRQIDLQNLFPENSRAAGAGFTGLQPDTLHRQLWLLSHDGRLRALDLTRPRLLQDHLLPVKRDQRAGGPRLLNRDRRGNLWLVSGFRHLYRFSPGTGELRLMSSAENSEADPIQSNISSLAIDPANLLWLGTHDGLYKAPLTAKGFRGIMPFPEAPDGSRDNKVSALHQDAEGKIWVAANYQQHHYDPRLNRFELGVNTRLLPEALQNFHIKTYFSDRAGNLWFGPLKRSPFVYLRERDEWLSLPVSESQEILVRAIREDRAGHIWFGIDFDAGGLYRYHPEDGTVKAFRHDPDDPSSISSNMITSLCEDRQGRMWVGTWGAGLNRFDPQTGSFTRFKADPKDPGSICDNHITSIVEDHQGRLWIGTWNGGVSRLANFPDSAAASQYRYETFARGDGPGDNLVCGLLVDSAGRLWIVHGDRLSCYDPQQDAFRVYTSEDGLLNGAYFVDSVIQARSGHIYIGGLNGIDVFHPDSLRINILAPPTAITAFKIFEQTVELDTGSVYKRHIILPYWQNFVSFEFAALDYVKPEENRYQYQLEGLQDEWIDSGHRGLAIFTNLDPGDYTFRARGSNNDGIWSEAGATLRLTITPPFWRTWWAYGIYCLMGIGLLYGGRWVARHWRTLIHIRARRISHYKLLSLLGKGGMGEVYKSLDLNTRKTVALKLLHPEVVGDPENRHRLATEGRLLTGFDHPHIVKVLAIGETGKEVFIAMEYLSGGTLQAYLEAHHPLPLKEALRLMRQIALGLQEIHRQGIVHRDLKLANIMRDHKGDIRIMDFGLSKSPLIATMTSLGTVIGTLGYVAPEQITGGQTDRRVDIFSFGVLAYTLLTGQMPFKGENEMALIHSIFNHQPLAPAQLRHDIPAKIDDLVMNCLAKNPENRAGSVEEILTQYLTGVNGSQ